jgi:hypothetical protein
MIPERILMSLAKFLSVILSFLVFNVFLCAYAARDATNSIRNKAYIEKNRIFEIAGSIAGKNRVNNEIEVINE